MTKTLFAALSGVFFGTIVGISGHQLYVSQKAAPEQRVVCVCNEPAQPCPAQQTVSSLTVLVQPEMEEDVDDDDASDVDPDRRLSEAQTAYVNGHYTRSIQLARSVQHLSPMRAHRIIGSAACNTHDTKLVNESYRRVDATGRQYLIYVCQRQGVTLRGKRFYYEQ